MSKPNEYFKKEELSVKRISIIRHNRITITQIYELKECFYDNIVETLFDLESLCLYLTDIKVEKEILNTDLEEIKLIFKGLFINPDSYYEDYLFRNEFINKIMALSSIEEIAKELLEAGYIKKESKAKIHVDDGLDDVKKHWKKVIISDTSYGYFGEILFYSFLRELYEKKLLLSKLYFITSPGTFAHGSDGIFFDLENESLIFGEAKFTNDLEAGLKQALYSLNDFEKRLAADTNVIVKSKRSLKGGSLVEEKFKSINHDGVEKMNKEIFVFVMHGFEINKDDIEEIINKYIKKFNIKTKFDTHIISFPIISKDELIKKIAESVQAYE